MKDRIRQSTHFMKRAGSVWAGFFFWGLLLFSQSILADIHVVDFMQRDVVVERPVKRIIALAPHIVENIYTAGGGHTIVGVVDHTDYPEAAKKIPIVGKITSYSLETIVALKPDLVVIWASGRGVDVLEKLLDLGIKVYASDPHTLQDVSKAIRDYGKLVGTELHAEKQAAAFELRYRQLQKRYEGVRPVTTFYQVWHEPLQTLSGQHIVSDIIRLCGGVNIFHEASTIAPKVSVESVLAQKPEAIITSGKGQDRPATLDSWSKWDVLPAVKHDHLFHIHPDILLRHTVRILDGANAMCEHLDHVRRRDLEMR